MEGELSTLVLDEGSICCGYFPPLLQPLRFSTSLRKTGSLAWIFFFMESGLPYLLSVTPLLLRFYLFEFPPSFRRSSAISAIRARLLLCFECRRVLPRTCSDILDCRCDRGGLLTLSGAEARRVGPRPLLEPVPSRSMDARVLHRGSRVNGMG